MNFSYVYHNAIKDNTSFDEVMEFTKSLIPNKFLKEQKIVKNKTY